MVLLGDRVGDPVGVELPARDLPGQFREPEPVRPGVGAEGGERVVQGELPAFGEDAFGLFDGDPAGQRGLELAAFEFAVVEGALPEDGDGGDVREGPGRA